MHSKGQTDADGEDVARCAYTGRPVETPNGADVSISREVVIEMIENGDTRLEL